MGGKKKLWVLGAMLIMFIAAACDSELLQAEEAASVKPKSLVTTFKGDPRTSRAFTWQTNNPDTAAILQLAKGTQPEALEGQQVITIKGTTTTIDIGKGRLQGVHKVNADNLESGTDYTYRVGNGDPDGWSEPATFTTETEGVSDFTFINVTDSQGVTDSDFKLWGHTLNQAFGKFPDARFIVHNGDLTENPEDESGWDYFFKEAKAWLTRFPLMPATGNHDEVDENADRYISHFNVPDNGADGSIPGTTYSFDYGPVHFVFLNTESNIKGQTKWLRQDLSATDKPWIIVALHRGPYGGNQDKSILKRWVPVFDEFGVDLVLQGHNHEYSRSFPLKDDKIVAEGKGTVYVVTNASGAKLNVKKKDKYYHQVHFQPDKQTFAGIRINGDTLTYQAYDIDGTKLDEFVLKH